MVYQIAADGVVNAHFEGELQLGADAIDAADQNRIGELLFVYLEETAEAAYLAEDTLVERTVSEVLDALFRAIRLLDIDASVGVCQAPLFDVFGQDNHIRGEIFEGCRESRL
jgi:hypothetical protein